jgi:hypothetical protein
VFSNVGAAVSCTMAATSASCWRIPSSMAGWKSVVRIRLKSGAW